MSKREVYYFGCWGEAGHYLWSSPPLARIWGQEDALRIPRASVLDGSLLFLPRPEQFWLGALTYLPACDLTVLAWWGSPWDKRGGVNAAVLARGVHDAAGTWLLFREVFPEIEAPLAPPKLAGEQGS